MSNCVRSGHRLDPETDDMVNGICHLCVAAGHRSNDASMKHFREQGHEVEKLPGGGFSIKGKKKGEE